MISLIKNLDFIINQSVLEARKSGATEWPYKRTGSLNLHARSGARMSIDNNEASRRRCKDAAANASTAAAAANPLQEANERNASRLREQVIDGFVFIMMNFVLPNYVFCIKHDRCCAFNK